MRKFVFLLILPLLAVFMLAAPLAKAETRESYLKKTALISSYRELFAGREFALLDKEMHKAQRAYEEGKWDDLQLWDLFFYPFYGTDPSFEEAYDKWIAAYPKSYVAHLARGKYFYDQAIQLIREAKKTSRVDKLDQMQSKDLAELKRCLELAIKESIAALGLTAKPVLAYINLVGLYSLSGSLDKSRKMLDAANKIAPQNIWASYQYMYALDFAALDKPDVYVPKMGKFMEEVQKRKLKRENLSGTAGVYHARLLKERRYDLLDRAMNQVQQDYQSDKIDDATLQSEFSVFGGADPEMAENYDAWVKAYPRSYAARQARSSFYLEKALLARGEGYISETSDKEVKGMQLYLRKALEESLLAGGLAKKPLLAYENVLIISKYNGDNEIGEQMFRMANRIDPDNSVVRFEYMHGLQTRWGGSLSMMEIFLKETKAAGVSDLRLLSFERMILTEKFWLANKIIDTYSNMGQLVTGF